MEHTKLGTCPLTGKERTLYSFRHTYATFALLNDGMSMHLLATQMGTSIAMIERHYSHLTPGLQKELLTGKRRVLTDEEYRKQQALKSNALPQTLINAEVDDSSVRSEEAAVAPAQLDADDTSQTTASNQTAPTPSQPHANTPTAAERAFNMFDSAKLNEQVLLAALQVDCAGYEPDERLSVRALKAVEEGRLSQDALIKVLGGH